MSKDIEVRDKMLLGTCIREFEHLKNCFSDCENKLNGLVISGDQSMFKDAAVEFSRSCKSLLRACLSLDSELDVYRNASDCLTESDKE